MHNLKIYLFALGLLLPFSAEAVISNVADQIKLSSLSFYSNISTMALSLLFALFTVAFTWKTISLVLKGADFQEITVAAIRGMISVGVYAMFIKNGDVWLKTIVDGSQMMAAQGAGISSNILNPGAIMGLGIDLQDSMVKNFNAASGADSFIGAISNFFPSMQIMVACLMILAAFAMISFTLFLTYGEMYMIIAVAPFMFALGGTDWTKDNALKPFQSMIAMSVKIMVLALVATIAIQSAPSWATQLATWQIDDWRPMWTVAFQILTVGIFALVAPKMAATIMAGGTSMSAGDVLQAGGNIGSMATGAGAIALGAAAAGASGAGKAAQALGGAGAEIGGIGKALKAGFDHNRNLGMGSGQSGVMPPGSGLSPTGGFAAAIQAPIPGIKSAASMVGAKAIEAGKSFADGGKGMLAQAGDAINNSVGGQVAEHIKNGSTGEKTSTTDKSSPAPTSANSGSGKAPSAPVGNNQSNFSGVQTPQQHQSMMDKLSKMRDWIPPDQMISGASVSHVHHD